MRIIHIQLVRLFIEAPLLASSSWTPDGDDAFPAPRACSSRPDTRAVGTEDVKVAPDDARSTGLLTCKRRCHTCCSKGAKNASCPRARCSVFTGTAASARLNHSR